MERIGEKLRRRREELGFTIDDIARATKYRPDVIKAVEEGRAGVFPAVAYRQAFLRAYADKLGLDPAEVVREQKSEEERVREALKGIRLKPRTGPGLRRTLIWLAVVVAVAVAILALYDRVIKVRGLRETAEETESPRAGGAEATPPGMPDSQAVAVPLDSAGIDSRTDETRDRDRVAPGDDDLEETGSSQGDVEDAEPEETGSSQEEAEDATPEETASSQGDVEDTKPEETASAQGEPEGEGGTVPETIGKLEGAGAASDYLTAENSSGDREGEPAEGGVSEPGGPGGRDWLAVRVRGYAVKARLRAGDSILVDRWLEPDFSDTFYSFQPFWADTIIADGNSILLVLNGEKVDLPSASGSVITDFRISP